jgi:hypothetical protein
MSLDDVAYLGSIGLCAVDANFANDSMDYKAFEFVVVAVAVAMFVMSSS